MKNCSLYLALFTAMIALIPGLSKSEIINVPEDQETIQNAIDAADNGDIVLVAPGEYPENINFDGKAITVTSLIQVDGDPAYIDSTIINGDREGSVVTFNNNEDENSVLSGFTVTNGAGNNGGGILCGNADPVLSNLYITECRANAYGGGISCENGAEPVVSNAVLSNNSAVHGGGLSSQSNSHPVFNDVLIETNTAHQTGGGVFCEALASMNNVDIIENRSASWGTAIIVLGNGQLIYHQGRVIRNSGDGACIFVNAGNANLDHILILDNRAERNFSQIACANILNGCEVNLFNLTVISTVGIGLGMDVEYQDIHIVNCIVRGHVHDQIHNSFRNPARYSNVEDDGGENGCIDQDPLFVDPENDDYHLQNNSPCIDTGDPDFPPDPDGSRSDMGAFPLSGGYVEGIVLDAEDDSPMEGVEINSSLGQITQSDENGFFRLQVSSGIEFELQASHMGFNPNLLQGLQVDINDTLEVEFNMLHPELSVSVNRFEVELEAGETNEHQFELSNDGNGEMDWWVSTRLAGEAGADPWTIRREILAGQVFDDAGLRGVIYVDGRFYISGSHNRSPVIYVLNDDGEEVAIYDQPGEDVRGMRDLAYDGELLWGSDPDGIYAVTLDGEHHLTIDTPVNPTTCVVWDSNNNHLWVSGTTSDIIALDVEGNEFGELERQGLRIYGLAYHPEDPDGFNLYIYNTIRLEDGNHPAVHKMSTETGELMFVEFLDTERGGNTLGAFITDQYDVYNSWVMMAAVSAGGNAGGDRVDVWQIEANSDWMVLDPSDGSLDPDGSIDITLTINSDGLNTVVWEGELVFNHAVAVEEIMIPVTLSVFEENEDNERELVVNLQEGWNLISINISPLEHFWTREEGPDIIRMTEQLRIDEDNHHIILLKDETGRFYAPGFNFNNISYWNLTQAYQFKLDEVTETVWQGEQINPDTNIPLEEGWNFIAYFPEYELDASSPDYYALSPIIEFVVIAKDANGRFMSPAFNFSNMFPWRETQGYQVKVDADVVLNYPPEREMVFARNEMTKQPQRLRHFVRKDRTGENMSLLIKSFSEMEISAGSEIAAFDPDGKIVGSGKVDHQGQCGLTIWGDDSSTDQIDGMEKGEVFSLKLWHVNQDQELELTLESILFGEGLVYQTNGYSVVVTEVEDLMPIELFLSEVYPNPFNSMVRVDYGLPDAAIVSISAYDIAGRLVEVLVNQKLPAGYHTAIWEFTDRDGGEIGSGVYFIRMVNNGYECIQKAVLVR